MSSVSLGSWFEISWKNFYCMKRFWIYSDYQQYVAQWIEFPLFNAEYFQIYICRYIRYARMNTGRTAIGFLTSYYAAVANPTADLRESVSDLSTRSWAFWSLLLKTFWLLQHHPHLVEVSKTLREAAKIIQ